MVMNKTKKNKSRKDSNLRLIAVFLLTTAAIMLGSLLSLTGMRAFAGVVPTVRMRGGAPNLEISIQDIRRASKLGVRSAPDGLVFMTIGLELRIDNAAAKRDFDLSQHLELIEDGAFVYYADPAGRDVSPQFYEIHTYRPGSETLGKVVFLVPATTGELVLHLNLSNHGQSIAADTQAKPADVQAEPKPDVSVTAPQSPLQRLDSTVVDRSLSINPKGEEVNVAAHAQLSWQLNSNTVITDGKIDMSGRGEGYQYWAKGDTFTVGFSRAYTIERLRIGLQSPEGPAGYRYKIEGSLDGKTWQVLVDGSTQDHRGVENFAIGPVRMRMLRVTSLSGPDGYLYVSELEAYTRDPVPDVTHELSAGENGGKVVEARPRASPGHEGSIPGFENATGIIQTPAAKIDVDAAWLIDGYPEHYWFREDVTAPEFTFAFHEHRLARIDAVAVFDEHYYDMPPAKNRIRHVEILVSKDSATGSFRSIAYVELPESSLASLIPLPVTEARYVKVRVLDNYGAKSTSVGGIAVFEAPGSRSIFDDFLIHPTGNKEILDNSVPIPALHAERNIAAFSAGGRVYAALEGGKPVARASNLINGIVNYSDEVEFTKTPIEITLRFFRWRAAEVSQVNIMNRAYDRPGGPKEVILESAMQPTGPFDKIGPTYVLANVPYRWFAIRFAPRRMRYLRIRILSHHTGAGPGVGEIQVIEAGKPGDPSITDLQKPETLFKGSRNIAHQLLGGEVATDVKAGRKNWPLANLIDGLWTDELGVVTPSFGWTTKAGVRKLLDLILSFAKSRTAMLSGLAIDANSRIAKPGFWSSAYYGSRTDWPSTYEVDVSTQSRDGPWTKIGRTEELLQRAGNQALKFAKPVKAKYVRIRLLDNFGGDRIQLGEIKLYEAPTACGRSVAYDQPINLISPMLGGAIVRFTSQSGAGWADSLIDGGFIASGFGDKPWVSSGKPLPQSFTFAFNRTQSARFDKIELDADPKADVRQRPQKVRVEISTDGNPLKGYTSLGDFNLVENQDHQIIVLSKPATARFVRLTFLQTFGAPNVALGEVSIWESEVCDGYESITVVGRKDPVEDTTDRVQTFKIAGDLKESEPNDEPAKANPVALGQRIVGTISPDSDVDFYSVDTRPLEKPGLLVRLQGDPTVRTQLAVQDMNGRVLEKFDPKSAVASTTLHWNLPRGEYRLRVSEPRTSVVLLFDMSGSMTHEVDALRKAADRYVRDRAQNEEIAIVKFDSNVTTVHDFSTDTESLRNALRRGLVVDGSTKLYDGIMRSLDLLKDRPGQRAIVLLSDGADTASRTPLEKIWNSLAAEGVRMFTIALGSDLNVYNHRVGGNPGIGTTSGRLLEFWARATQGKYFYSPGANELAGVYRDVSRILRSQPQYALTPILPKPDGYLEVTASGKTRQALGAGNILFILDASGSMRGKNSEGIEKMQVAKTVMHRLVAELPDSARVALRVYGQRFPSRPKARSCMDSELLVPLARLDRAALLSKVDAIRPKGQTPLGLSIALTSLDFNKVPGSKVAILITDGKETCNVSPTSGFYPLNAIRLARGVGINFRLNIVGFDIANLQTRQLLSAVAENGGGKYYDANTTNDLINSLRRSLALGFIVRDPNGTAVGHGQVGGKPVELPAGNYEVDVEAEPLRVLGHFDVVSGRTTHVTLGDKGGPQKPAVVMPEKHAAAKLPAPRVPPQTGTATPEQIAEIRQVWARCLEAANSPQARKLILVRPSQQINVASAKAWTAPTSNPPAANFDRITIYRVGEATRFAELGELLPGIGAKEETQYCFRGDGSLAFAFTATQATLPDMQGANAGKQARIELRYYFDSAGHNIREIDRILNADSRKPLRTGRVDFNAFRPRYYPSAQSIDRSLVPPAN